MTELRPSCPLDPLQMTIMRMMADGRRQVDIAHDMKVAQKVVRANMLRAQATMGARNAAHLMALLYRSGYMDECERADV